MTDTLAPVERTNWALSAWNSTLDQNDVPSAWLYGQDHLWATSHLVSSPGGLPLLPFHIDTSDQGKQLQVCEIYKIKLSSKIILVALFK